MGPGRAATFAQNAANKLGVVTDVDGKLGKNSFAAINSLDPKAFLQAYADEMAAYYLNLIARKPKLAKFQKNWLRRARWGL
jgi:lysozyme family protein